MDDPRRGCQLIFKEFLRRGLSLEMRPPLSFEFRSLVEALSKLKLSIPAWLVTLNQNLVDSDATREALIMAMFDS